jgi:hypothetical protein
MDIISRLSSHFERYLTIERVHASATYDYRARGMYGLPVFVTTMHRPKCAGGSWTYIAVAHGANPAALIPGERLYVGSQTMDRMFRGDGMRGTNFHHAQMRRQGERYTRSAATRGPSYRDPAAGRAAAGSDNFRGKRLGGPAAPRAPARKARGLLAGAVYPAS